MNAIRNLAILLIEAGVIGLVYTNFTYTKQTEEIKVEPIEKSVKEKQTVQVPIWAGAGAIVLGGLLLVFGNKRS
jgi:hypothetical protein